ncbi:hypothetical protein ACFLWC_00270 [Chloroflexota bacterium]
MPAKDDNPTSVIVTGGNSINNLGVVRNLGRHGVPIVLLSADHVDMVRYSRYISKKITSPSLNKPETQFIDCLLDIGKQMNKKHMLIPTNDIEALILSRYRDDLEQFYILPMPSLKVIQKLVDKKRFYKLLDQLSIPHPKTYFPKDIAELKSIAEQIEYPYIIKPAYSHLFAKEFGSKNFAINSQHELNKAVEKLGRKDLEVVIQEIIPGNEIYMFYTYFNKDSEPVAICGYDKLRQYPPDFGSGSLCRSSQRHAPIDLAIQVLKAIKYYGIAEPEFKRDPRDGKYKLLEINARTTTESSLPPRCGVNIEYTAYLDATGQYVGNKISSPRDGILWVDEIGDLASCLKQWKDGKLGAREIISSFKGEKVYARAARDDPFPFFVSFLTLGFVVVLYLLKCFKELMKRKSHC